MLEEDFETAIKVIVVGNGGVGKTSMIRRFCTGNFTDNYKKTIGVDFLEKEQYIQALGENVTLMLWDTAGQEEFDAITRHYYRGAGACVLVFSTTDRASFEAVGKWKKKVEAECGDIVMCIVQNKVDLLDQAVMNSAEAEEMARNLGLKFYRACVKDNTNVTSIFDDLAQAYVQTGAHRRAQASGNAPMQSIATVGGDKEGDTNTNAFANTAAQDDNKAFQLQKPNKQRTGGKKKVMPCSIL